MNATMKAVGPTEMLLSSGSEVQEADGRKHKFARRLTPHDAVAVLAPLLPIGVLAALLAGVIRGAYIEDDGCGMKCDPNGNIQVSSCFSYGIDKGNPFDVDYSLAIGLGWGELSFATAKAIDVLWDAFVGRSCQALAAWVVYAVFRRCWAKQYERAKVDLPVRAVMSLQYQTISTRALCSYASLLGGRALASRRAAASTLVLLLSTVHVFLAPTWLSAMTGYMALSDPMVQLDGANFVAAEGLRTCNTIIRDGDRIGLTKNACIEQPEGDSAFAFYDMTSDQGCETIPKAGCEWYSASTYLMTNQPYNAETDEPMDRNINSTFYGLDHVYHLSPPLLTIDIPTQYMVGYDDQIYTTDYLRSNGVCQPRNKYKWGFSFNLTFAWLLASNVLALLLYAVWLTTFRGRELADAVFGSEKTVMVIAEAYQDVLGREAARMNNAELASARKQCHIGVDVSKCSGADVGLSQEERKRSVCDFVA